MSTTSASIAERVLKSVDVQEEVAGYEAKSDDLREIALRASRIPPRYQGASWDGFRIKRKHLTERHGEKAEALCQQLSSFRSWMGEPPNEIAYLCGGPGRGKTHLAACTLRRWVDAGKRGGLFVVVPDFLADLKASFGTGRTDGILRQVQDAGLLVLDDLGAEMATDWVRDTLYQVLNHRYNRQLPTVITSNLVPGEVANRYHARLGSRLASGFILDLFILPDYRLRKETT